MPRTRRARARSAKSPQLSIIMPVMGLFIIVMPFPSEEGGQAILRKRHGPQKSQGKAECIKLHANFAA